MRSSAARPESCARQPKDFARSRMSRSSARTCARRTVQYLESEAGTLTVGAVSVASGRLHANVTVENLGGHKLRTAYPSRRAWIHFRVRRFNGDTIFESGALNRDGSIAGNDNDT